MESLERARQFEQAFDAKVLEAGDGTDGKPIWAGVNTVTGQVYRLFADGVMQEGEGALRMISRAGFGPHAGKVVHYVGRGEDFMVNVEGQGIRMYKRNKAAG